MFAAVVCQRPDQPLRGNRQKQLSVGALLKGQIPLLHKAQHVLRRKALEGRGAKCITPASVTAVVLGADSAVGKVCLAAAADSQLAPRHRPTFQQHNAQAF